MRLDALSFGFKGLWGGEDHLGLGALLADVESEYLPVHPGLYSHQYAYYYCCHERGALLLYMRTRSMPHGGTQRSLKGL
jgi:hypothetical protein